MLAGHGKHSAHEPVPPTPSEGGEQGPHTEQCVVDDRTPQEEATRGLDAHGKFSVVTGCWGRGAARAATVRPRRPGGEDVEERAGVTGAGGSMSERLQLHAGPTGLDGL